MQLTDSERGTLRALADTIVPRTGEPSEPLGASASDVGVDALMEQAVTEFSTPEAQRQFRRLLGAVESPLLNLVLAGRAVRFSALSPEEREAYLLAWSRSPLPVKRRGFHALKRLAAFLHYSALPDGGTNPAWPAIGYDPPDDAERARHRTPPDLRIEPVFVDSEATLEADLCVIGSGAGGSVIAATVARAGFRVLVLEAGPFRTPETFDGREMPATHGMLEGHGLLTSKDLAFGVLHGRTAGGGTVVNWMTCLRTPRRVLEEWEREWGIPGLTGPGFQAQTEEVWARLGVSTAESVLTPPSEVLKRGCEALGYQQGVDFHITPKNARGCENRCDHCNFGCVYSGKQSALVTYLVDASRAGARLLCDTEARRLVLRGDAAAGVEAVHRRDGREVPVHVKAKAVVVAAGAVRTPALLLESGLRHRGIGRGLRFHPTTAVGATYGHDVRMWAGVPQTLHVDRWLWSDADRWGFWLETVPAHPGLTALGLPWRGGRAHKEAMRGYRRTMANIVLVRDRSAGRVSVDRDGNPVLDYRMREEDRRLMVRGIVESARIHAAAGATQVWSLHNAGAEIPHRDGPIGKSEVDAFADRVRRIGIPPNGLALFSAHAMGSVPMGASDRLPTKPTGELRAARRVFIGDGSVFPSASAVNPMVSIMAMARRTADFVLQALRLEF